MSEELERLKLNLQWLGEIDARLNTIMDEERDPERHGKVLDMLVALSKLEKLYNRALLRGQLEGSLAAAREGE